MSYNPFVFVRSYQDRFNTLKSFLVDCVKASDVQSVWSSYVEMSVEPVGWKALWKIPRNLCTDFKINYPCTVIVCVEHVNVGDLSCLVSINEVEDESICLPERMNDVPLIQLYPTKEQDTSLALSKLFETAELLDNMRFFYNHLWMPWDSDPEADEEDSWVEIHLEGRLQLHFMMVERKLPHDITYLIRQLTSKGHRAQEEFEDIQEEVLMEVEGGGEEKTSSARLLQLTELHNTLCHLRNQYNIYEKPELLKALLEKKKSFEKSQDEQPCESVVYLVLSDTTVDQLASLAHLAKQIGANKKSIRLVQSLQEAVTKAPVGSCIWLTSGKHHVQDLGVFESGGTIMGIEQEVELVDDPECCFSLLITKGSLNLENLTLNLTTNMSMIKVRPGAECHLKEVNVEGVARIDGIDVFPAAKLTAEKSHFRNCDTAVICDIKSSVNLTNCSFTDNNIALKLKEGADFLMESCSLSGSKMFGVQLVGSGLPSGQKHSISDINSLPGMKESSTTCKNNTTDLHCVQSNWKNTKFMNGDI